MAQDLSNFSYDAWVDFVFNHPVSPISEAWHFQPEWAYSCPANVLISNLTHLFRNTSPLISRFSAEQIDQGFWFIPSSNGFMWAILSSEVSFDRRSELISAISVLFDELFCKHEIGTSGYMWWDSVFSYCVLGNEDLGTDMKVLEQVALTISQMLRMECSAAKASAKHGVDHLVKVYRATKSSKIREIICKQFDLTQLGIKLD